MECYFSAYSKQRSGRLNKKTFSSRCAVLGFLHSFAYPSKLCTLPKRKNPLDFIEEVFVPGTGLASLIQRGGLTQSPSSRKRAGRGNFICLQLQVQLMTGLAALIQRGGLTQSLYLARGEIGLFCLSAFASKLASSQTKKPFPTIVGKGICARDWISFADPKGWSYPKPFVPQKGGPGQFYLSAIANKFASHPNKIALHIALGDMEGICARDWIRTSTSFRTPPPEDGASTSFATRASVITDY